MIWFTAWCQSGTGRTEAIGRSIESSRSSSKCWEVLSLSIFVDANLKFEVESKSKSSLMPICSPESWFWIKLEWASRLKNIYKLGQLLLKESSVFLLYNSNAAQMILWVPIPSPSRYLESSASSSNDRHSHFQSILLTQRYSFDFQAPLADYVSPFIFGIPIYWTIPRQLLGSSLHLSNNFLMS